MFFKALWSMEKETVIRAEALQLRRRGFGPIDLDFYPGELVLLCGTSGSGKSTLCELLSETQEPSEGRIVRNATVVGYVAHAFENQLVGATVAEELAIGSRGARAVLSRELEASLANLEASLENSLGEDPHSLSAALQQCLLLASLIRSGATFLILDESMAYLDGRTRRDFARTLLELVASGCTVFLVSHQEEFLELAGRVIFMERGEKIFDGAIGEFESQYFERAGFRKDTNSEALISRLPEFKPEEFDGVEVVAGSKRLNLRVASSLVLGGFSGSGTSTALNSLMGLEEREYWRCTGAREKSCLLRQNVGPSFWRSTCAAELKASRGAHQPLSRPIEEAVLNSIPAGWLEKAPWHLSHGQLRFFGASCLLLQNPQVLYLDHPFQGLDGTLREKLRYSLSEYLKGGGRVVLTTHDPEKVRGLGHQVVWLEGGSLLFAGLTSDEGWASLSIGLSSKSLLPGPMEEDRVKREHG